MTDGTAVESLTVVFLQAQECAGIAWEGRFLRRLRLSFFKYGVGDCRLVLMLRKSCVEQAWSCALTTHHPVGNKKATLSSGKESSWGLANWASG